MPELSRAGAKRADVFVEEEHRHPFAARGGGRRELRRHRGLARASRSQQQRAGAGGQASTEKSIQLRIAARPIFVDEFCDMFRGDEPRKDVEAAAANREIVIPAAKGDAAHLGHAEAASFRAVLVGQLLEETTPWAILCR